METCALSALTGKYGVQRRKHVNVKEDTNGMGNTVREPTNAQEIEFGTQPMSNVSVPPTITGAVMPACQFPVAREASFGVEAFKNVFVPVQDNLMEPTVFSVPEVKFGAKQT